MAGQVDIIVSSTSASGYVLDAARLQPLLRARRARPLLLIDLAVPRDIDPAIAGFDDAYLYTVDDLEHVLEESRAFRQQAAAEAENLIDLQVGHFFAELKALEHQGGLLRLRSHIAQVRDRHLEKARLALARGEDADAVMETLAHQLSNKILHGPTSAWKRAALEGDTALLRAAEQLFRLDDDAQP